MRSQPDVAAGSYESRDAWSSTAVRDRRWLLTARTSPVVGGDWCG
jgi:hypothetical protein